MIQESYRMLRRALLVWRTISEKEILNIGRETPRFCILDLLKIHEADENSLEEFHLDFKKTVKDKKIWVREEELQNIPAILKKEYQLLQQSVQNDDICGALFRLKDIYEISIKLPSILSIITISARMESDRAFVRMSETQLKKEQEDFSHRA